MTKSERNAAIIKGWKAGASTADLAAAYDLTGSRIIQIIRPFTTREERRKRNADATKAKWQDPEFRRSHHMKNAKRCVRQAALPLLKTNVERARAMLDAGCPMEVVVGALRQDQRMAA